LGSEKRFAIDANHRTMCRFSSKEDDGYKKISREFLHISKSLKDLKGKEHEKKNDAPTEQVIKCQYRANFSPFVEQKNTFP
jgi:hypothetical protein